MAGLHSCRDSMRWDENENVKGTFVLFVTFSTSSVSSQSFRKHVGKSYPSQKDTNVSPHYSSYVQLRLVVLAQVKHQLQMICETSVRWEKHARCEKLARKKGRAGDNKKINFTHFAIWLFSRTIIILSLIAWKNPFVSCIITTSTARLIQMREICLVKRHKKYEITRTHVSRLACFLCFTDVLRIVYSRLICLHSCVPRLIHISPKVSTSAFDESVNLA